MGNRYTVIARLRDIPDGFHDKWSSKFIINGDLWVSIPEWKIDGTINNNLLPDIKEAFDDEPDIILALTDDGGGAEYYSYILNQGEFVGVSL